MTTHKITIKANGQAFEIDASTRLHDFLQTLKLTPTNVVVERNKCALTPLESKNTILEDGDRLEIVRIVAGG